MATPRRPYLAFLLSVSFVGLAFAQSTARHSTVLPTKDRKRAPNFSLQDSSGKAVQLSDYRGKVVLLDFWATWCSECQEQIAYFSSFHAKYAAKGFTVIGLAMDEQGWNTVNPFLADMKVPYPIILGNISASEDYSIRNLPDAFLIDRQGRIAVAHPSIMLNTLTLDANIRALLAER